MLIHIGLLDTQHQIHMKSLNTTTGDMDKKTIAGEEIKNEECNLLFFDPELDVDPLKNLLATEERIYPVLDYSVVSPDKRNFNELNFSESSELFSDLFPKWILTKNLQTIENFNLTVTELKNLWSKNRDQFFEQLWTLLKINLGSVSLRVMFHDLSDLTAEQQEKGEKPSLTTSIITGNKIPQKKSNDEIAQKLMQDYKKEFGDTLKITEFDTDSHQLVLCASIQKSPILIMAEVKDFNQLQRAIVFGLFNGLNA